MPTRRATSCSETAARPDSAAISQAAARICSRRCDRRSATEGPADFALSVIATAPIIDRSEDAVKASVHRALTFGWPSADRCLSTIWDMSGTWVVTGGAGYIGGHVVAALHREGVPVVVLDDLSTGRPERVPAGV